MLETFTLISHTGMQACISNLGCILQSLKVPDRKGNRRETVLGFDDLSSYSSSEYLSNYPYFGAIIGRYANRISNGNFTLNGHTYQLPQNHSNHTLHGGNIGFDRRVWNPIQYVEEYNGFVILEYLSPDGEEGFPGNLITQIKISVEGNSLTFQISARTDMPTPVNLSLHTYFNLDEDHSSCGSQMIRTSAQHRLIQDLSHCPTGEIADLSSFAENISAWTQVSMLPDLDSTFVLEDHKGNLQLAAEAMSSDRNLHLRVCTDQPAVHIYTGSGIPTLPGRKGHIHRPGNGYCFETQIHTDAVHHPHFPSSILIPGQVYKHTTQYIFE